MSLTKTLTWQNFSRGKPWAWWTPTSTWVGLWSSSKVSRPSINDVGPFFKFCNPLVVSEALKPPPRSEKNDLNVWHLAFFQVAELSIGLKIRWQFSSDFKGLLGAFKITYFCKHLELFEVVKNHISFAQNKITIFVSFHQLWVGLPPSPSGDVIYGWPVTKLSLFS